MKLTTFLLLVSLIQVSAASFGQKVTLKAGETTVNNIFKEIRKQTGYSVMLDKANFKTERKVPANFNNASLQMVMDQVLEGTGFTYVIEDKNIIVEQKEKSLIERIVDRFSAIDVSGKVLDSEGKPLPGATVTVKGTKISTTTQNDGSFILKGVNDDAILVISYMGFEAKEIKAERNLGLIRLTASTNPLDEVQVIAYGTTTRRLSTGNIGTVKSKDIENQPVTNPLLALQGRVPGLVITQSTGVPGGGVKVRVQGQNSMLKGNTPLYVIDNVPIESYIPALFGSSFLGDSGPSEVSGGNEGNPLNYLNPTDIESIDILKDADATAIYGSRAANGAILITTKKGKVGKMELNANINTGWGTSTFNNFEMLNTRQYLDMRYEAFKNDGIDWRSPNVNAPDLKLWDTTRNINWRKELLSGTAIYTNMRMGITGGSAGIQYRLAGTYNRTSSIFPDNGNGNPIASISTNINSISVNQKFRMTWSTNYQYNQNETPTPTSNFFQAAWSLPPNAPEPFNADGTINWAPDVNGNSTNLYNPYVGMKDISENTTKNLLSNLIFDYKIGKDLEFNTSLGYSDMQINDFRPFPTGSVQPELRSDFLNRAEYGSRSSSSWIAEPKIIYRNDTDFGKIELLLGSTLRESNSKGSLVTGYNYSSDELLLNIQSATTLTASSYNRTYKYLAYFGRLNYNLKDQLIINLNLRRDGSSRFGENRRFANFWSTGGAWIFSKQKLLSESLPWLSFAKVRASYGITGSDQIGDFGFIRTYSNYSLQIPYQGLGSLQSTGVPNPNLEWERVKKFSSGLDLGFFENRFLVSVGYSHNISDNQLTNYPLSTVTGTSAMERNLDATIKNTTWEFSLNSSNIKGKDFEWSTDFNLSLARNILVDYPNLETSTYSQQYVIGQPLDIQKIIRFSGVNSATGTYQYMDKNGNPTTLPSSADMVYRSFFPTTYGGIQNTFRWKSISMDFFINFTRKWGSDIYYGNGTNYTPGVFSQGQGNQPVSVLNRWRKAGDVGEIAKFSTILLNGTEYILFSDARYTDASFARLKNVSFSWRLPTRWSSLAGLQSATVTASGQNLLTLTKYNGPDPEVEGLNSLPPLRLFTLGIQVVF